MVSALPNKHITTRSNRPTSTAHVLCKFAQNMPRHIKIINITAMAKCFRCKIQISFWGYIKSLLSDKGYTCEHCGTSYKNNIPKISVITLFFGLFLFHRVIFREHLVAITDQVLFLMCWFVTIILFTYIYFRHKFR